MSVGWNGHYLVGYSVAIILTFLISTDRVRWEDTAAESPVLAASSCDTFQEAFLTGTEADIRASVLVILEDKTANATAREIAKHYGNLNEANTSRQKTDLAIIQDYCSR